jgi:predicted metalloprotease
MGAIPWVVMQLILVVIVIFFPVTVTAFLGKQQTLDMNKATEQLQEMGNERHEQKPEEDAAKLFAPEPAASAASN